MILPRRPPVNFTFVILIFIKFRESEILQRTAKKLFGTFSLYFVFIMCS